MADSYAKMKVKSERNFTLTITAAMPVARQ